MEKVQNQYIYETTVNKTVKEKASEVREENGQQVTVSKDVDVVKPVKLAILKPNRRKAREAEIFYAKRLSFYLKEGLLTYALVNKRYLNDGGALSESTKKAVLTFREKLVELQTEYFGMKSPLTDENQKRRAELIIEIGQIQKLLSEFENSYSSLFDNTAETKTQNDMIEWWLTMLTMIDRDDGKGYVPFFGDADAETRLNNLDELESRNDDFLNEFIKKASYFVSFWNSAGVNLKPEDYKSAETHYQKEMDKAKQEKALEDAPETAAPPVPETPVS